MTCQYPNCQHPATVSWALAPVCLIHYDLIWLETLKYYERKISQDERKYYLAVRHLTPWEVKTS